MKVTVSCLVIASNFITLHLDMVTGVITDLIASTISAPYFIKSTAWDAVIMMMLLMSTGTGPTHDIRDWIVANKIL